MNSNIQILTRRSFLSRASLAGAGAALSILTDVPFVVRRALAEGSIGLVGPDGRRKKLLFIFLRGGSDSLNAVIPIKDPSYKTARPTLALGMDPGTNYDAMGPALFPESGPNNPTFGFTSALPLGNGFAALHPSLKFMAPVYNAGDLAIIHRVAYPKQSRSHFDSENYWETGMPNNKASKEGILYRAMVESGLASSLPLTGVSIQSSLPMILRGSRIPMTNVGDPERFKLLGGEKSAAALTQANLATFSAKENRQLLDLQYRNLDQTLDVFGSLNFSEAGNEFVDDANTDGDAPYHLFPTTNAKNGGYAFHNNAANRYVVPTAQYGFFRNLKNAAMILNKTDALVAGTQMGGWDTHGDQGTITGPHPNLLRSVAWAMYGLRKYFTKYADKASWDDVVVVTMSEFGRTTVENDDQGTDHAEAASMYVAGGKVKGFQPGVLGAGGRSGVINCGGDADPVPWRVGPTGSMFGVEKRYLKRAADYRSVLGKLIRDHLGATQAQLDRIIPGYTNPDESLKSRGVQKRDNTEVIGEPDIV